MLFITLALPPAHGATLVTISGDQWLQNGRSSYPGTRAEGLLLNVRMANAVFEDRNRPADSPDANTTAFLSVLPDYVRHGVRAFSINLQGGDPGYEGALNSAFTPDGDLRPSYMKRVRRVTQACDRAGAVVILGCFYQRQDQVLRDDAAVRHAVAGVARWLASIHATNVVLEIANEYGHHGYDRASLRTAAGQVALIRLAKADNPGLLVSTSGLGDGRVAPEIARAADFLLVHFNTTPVDAIPARLTGLRAFGKPVVCSEDDRPAPDALHALELCVEGGASWGLLLDRNQHFPFRFQGAHDAPDIYAQFQRLASEPIPRSFPPPESRGGWPHLETPAEIRDKSGMDPERLDTLRDWLLRSDSRPFSALVIRHGYVVLDVERGAEMRTSTANIKSCAKAIAATVAAIASERSRTDPTFRRMTFSDPAFRFLPWSRPLSDPRKERVTIRQILSHTSGIAPESTGARNCGPWEYILGHTHDPVTQRLAFDPGTDFGYSTHGFYHLALIIENVTGKPYDRFATEALLQPLGIERSWFEWFDGDATVGRHPTHGLGLPAREMARVAYCMLRNGEWKSRQVVPRWFVAETAVPATGLPAGMRPGGVDAGAFSLGWEIPARYSDGSGQGIPFDARQKQGSGGQYIAFVPSLDLVVVRQTGGSGDWAYKQYLRLACQAVQSPGPAL